jgi:hypothetical protein
MNYVQHLSLRQLAEPGMGRFFSLMNLDRYRRLANNEIAAAERSRVMKTLSEEWSAFTSEFGKAGAARVGPLREHMKFRLQDSP